MTGESLSSGPYISMPFIMFQTVCDEVRLLREEVERLQEYLEDMTREAS
jgi:ubiquinone biosynthesis protein UbiJ